MAPAGLREGLLLRWTQGRLAAEPLGDDAAASRLYRQARKPGATSRWPTLDGFQEAFWAAEDHRDAGRFAGLERELLSLHRRGRVGLQPPQVSPPAATDRKALERRFAAELNIVGLEQAVAAAKRENPEPPALDARVVRANHVRDALRGIPVLQRSERSAAKRKAEAAARAELEAAKRRHQEAVAAAQQAVRDAERAVAEARAEAERRAAAAAREQEAAARAAVEQEQRELDRLWSALQANDPDLALRMVEMAYADAGLPGTPLNVIRDEALICVLVPRAEYVPERRPAKTPGGKATLKKRTKTEINEFHLDHLAGLVVAAARQAMAVAPNLQRVQVLGLLNHDLEARDLEPLYFGTLSRRDVERGNPRDVITDAPDAQLEPRGRTAELAALDDPELRALAARIQR